MRLKPLELGTSRLHCKVQGEEDLFARETHLSNLKYVNHLHDTALAMNHVITTEQDSKVAMEQDSKVAMHLKAFTEVCQSPA